MATSQRQDIELGIMRYEYGDSDRKQVAVLQIQTTKHYNGGLISDASVYWVGKNSRSQLMSLGAGGGDYSKRVKVSGREVKATQKAIDKQHAEVFTAELLAQMTDEARLYYAAVVLAGHDGFHNTYPAAVAV